MTRAGISFGLGSLALVIAGRVLGLPEIVSLGIAGIVLIVCSFVIVRIRRELPVVERRCTPTSATVGDDVVVHLHIENSGRRRCPPVEAFDPITHHDERTPGAGATIAIATLAPGATAEASYRLAASRRGLVQFGPLAMRRQDPFGLVEHTVHVADHLQLLVLPVVERVVAPTGGRVDDLLATNARDPRASDRGEEFASLRGYVPGDDLRKVHWPTSARRGSLMVRKNDETRQPRCTLLLDLRDGAHDAETLERSISAAASLLTATIQNGDEARLVTTTGFDSLNGTGDGHLRLLLQELALATAGPSGSLIESAASVGSGSDALIVVTTDRSRPSENLGGERVARRSLTVVFASGTHPHDSESDEAATVTVASGESFAAAWANRFGPADPVRRRVRHHPYRSATFRGTR